jgi:hypothetical protein
MVLSLLLVNPLTFGSVCLRISEDLEGFCHPVNAPHHLLLLVKPSQDRTFGSGWLQFVSCELRTKITTT